MCLNGPFLLFTSARCPFCCVQGPGGSWQGWDDEGHSDAAQREAPKEPGPGEEGAGQQGPGQTQVGHQEMSAWWRGGQGGIKRFCLVF